MQTHLSKSNRIACSIVALTASLATAAQAQVQTAPGAPIHVDLLQSRVFARVGATGFGHEHGVEGKLSRGTLVLGATQNAGLLEFDMTSFVADGKAARAYVGLAGETDAGTAKKVTDNMLGAAVLDVAKHPAAKFAVDSAAAAQQPGGGKFHYRLVGQFTLHGVTKPLTLLAEMQPQADGSLQLRTQFAILQSQHGITPFSTAFGAVGVADKLTIWGDLHLIAAAQTARKP